MSHDFQPSLLPSVDVYGPKANVGWLLSLRVAGDQSWVSRQAPISAGSAPLASSMYSLSLALVIWAPSGMPPRSKRR